MTRRDEIAAAAREIVSASGPEALSMRSVAEALGIRAPSLYKHVSGRDEIVGLLQATALSEMGSAMHRAARSSREQPLFGIASAYRRYARKNPGLYALTASSPLLRELLPDGLEASAQEPLLAAVGGDQDRARAAWAFAHGMVVLELAGRFPPGANLDVAWRKGIEAFAV